MIILLSALVVIVAAVVLLIGMLSGTFALVYAGLALAAAGVVLLLIARYLGRSHHPARPEEPTPLPERVAPSSADEVGHEVGDPTGAFPIARYDSLWVTQIVPQLDGLSPDELAMIDARERGGRHRTGVLDAVAAVRRGEAPEPSEPPATDLATDPVAASAVTTEPETVERTDPPSDDVSGDEPATVEPETAFDGDTDGEVARVATFLGRPAAPIHVHTS